MYALAVRSCLMSLLVLTTSAFSAEKTPPPPPDLDGRTYAVVYPTEDKKPKDKLSFKDGKVTITSLGELEIPYKARVKANYKGVVSETSFNGSATAADGAKLELQGAVMANGEIRGSITRREKDVDATARNFNGKQAGGKK
jgi:hypothetical protein